ncbi:DNA repair protein RecO [Clostridiales bacterium oral taxon 876 str. F0540]|nr:DNA repair protein RecO [Clostridiales bacterium oral taxon 876 str. F0540]
MFSEKLGKISAVAKGAKKGKSKIMPLTLPFCFGEYVVFKGKSLYTINEGEIISSFQSLLSDLNSLTYASYFCELIDIALVEEESSRELFKNLISVFYLMENKAVDFETLARAFEIKLLMASGFSLNLDNCSVCRKKIDSSNFISLEYLGGVCMDCNRIHGMNISYSGYNALKYLINAPIENIYRLSLNKETKDGLYKLLAYIISNSFSRKPNSLDIFNYIKGVEGNE